MMKGGRNRKVLLCLLVAAALLVWIPLAATLLRGCAPASPGLGRLQQAVRDVLPGNDYYSWGGGEVLAFALAMAVLSLAGLWSGLREGSLPGRAAFCLGLAVVFIFVLRLACAGWSETELFRDLQFRSETGPCILVAVGLFATVPLGLFATAGALKLFGIRLVKGSPGGLPVDGPAARARPQFSIGELLVWTVLLASVLALVRLALELVAGLSAGPPPRIVYFLDEYAMPAPGGYARNALLVTVPVLAVWHVCFSLSAFWVSLGTKRLRLGLGVVVLLALLGLLIPALPAQDRTLTSLSELVDGVGLVPWAPAWYYLVYEGLVLGTLWMIGASGWQLVSAMR